MTRRAPAKRAGVAAVELAVLLPFLAFLFVIAVDWGRIFYYSVTVTNCARNGALWGVDPYTTTQSAYSNVTDAALADAPNLSPAPSVTSTTGTDSNGNYFECTVTYNFTTITNFPGVPSNNSIVRTVRVYQAQQFPN
jgi:Flp pilus assembly protein TadG